MQKKLDEAVEKFKKSQTTLEAYEAIIDFAKIIETVPEFIKKVEAEGENIRIAQKELNADKGWTYGLRGRDLKKHNENRDKKVDKYRIQCRYRLESWFKRIEFLV